MNKINEIEKNLLENDKQLNESYEKTDSVIDKLRQYVESGEDSPQKIKIKACLDSLEKKLFETQKLHEQELINLMNMHEEEKKKMI